MDDSHGSGHETLTIIIKTPNQACGDQVVEGIEIHWTVKDLKRHLSRVYPTNPAEQDQRLIYAGKLLPDQLRVSDVFRKSDTMPTIHLVSAFRTQPGRQMGPQPEVTPVEQHVAGTSVTGAGNVMEASAVPPSDGLRNRHHPTGHSYAWTSPAMQGAAMTQPEFPTYSLYSPQQLLWLQQMYARQYYLQYQAAMAAAASSPMTLPAGQSLPFDPHPAATPAALPNQPAIDNLPANQNVPDPQFINPAGANQNMRMNAQGGPVMEEEDLERDWLDLLYTAARLSVFLSIVYFYSSLSRFVLVMSSLLLMYLHTAGWFPFRRRPVVQGLNEQAPEVIQNQQNQNRNPEDVPAAEGEDVVSPMAGVLVEPHRVSLVWTAWVFFKAFFASLIPELPQGLAN